MKSLILFIVTIMLFSFEVYSQISLETYIINLPKQELSEKEKLGLILMREEEKLAQDVYLTLFDKWQSKMFDNIASSEKTHSDWVGILLNKYEIPDPIKAKRGEYTNQTLQNLYTSLVAKGNESLQNAYFVGCTIEDLDIKDLLDLIAETDNVDIKVVYQNLTLGSRNHLRSFNKNYSALGLVYKEQFITKEYLENVLKIVSEKGPVDENGNPLNLTSVENEIFNFNLLSLNPSIFSESTTISFTSKSASNCILTIFDVSGLIIKNESIPVSNNGEYQFVWEAYDYNNNKVANGVYYISIQTNKEIIYGKVILNR